MALNAWQKITRVMPGKPYGDGADGDLTISSSATQTQVKGTASASSGATALTTNTTGFANGDLVIIHQSQGTGVGGWEINKIASGGGTVNLTLQVATNQAYGTGAQIIKIPRYGNVTINSSQTWSAPDWDGSTGGFLIFAAAGVVTISGILSGSAKGFRAFGGSTADDGNPSRQGEGAPGAGTTSASANGNGGAGGDKLDGDYSGAGGGGNGSAGSNGAASASPASPGGAADGSSDLSDMVFGGAGGAPDQYESGSVSGASGDGGGSIVIYGRTISAPNSIVNTGANGAGGSCNAGKPNDRKQLGNGGGGAGGNVLLCGETIDIGTDKIDTRGGTGATGGANCWRAVNGGNGGKGRVAVHYGKSIAGSLSATYYGSYSAAQDSDMVVPVPKGSPMFIRRRFANG